MMRDEDLEMRVGRGDLPDGSDGVALSITEEGQVLLVPNAYKRLTGAQRAVLADLQAEALTIQTAVEEMEALVAQARELGVSWSMIAWSTGMTDTGAKKRWSQDDPADA